ncbi:MAG TPA: hypothetical protein VI934_01295 [Candidatus Nanoarchaeia archaeon]|nr:hypothetical protein [Candidatus Nanoarchaeia archaeon]
MVVMDSSTLILLAKLGALDKLLESIKEKVILGERVYREVTAKDTFDAKLIADRVKERLMEIRKIGKVQLFNDLMKDFGCGAGEAESITLSVERGTGIATDDKKAMNACKLLKVRWTTTADVLMEMYNKRKITQEEALAYAERLEKYGWYRRELIEKLKGRIKNE